MRTPGALVLALAVVAAGLAARQISAESQPTSLVVTSPAFKEGEAIPKKFGQVSPQLSWTGAPPTTRQYAVVLESGGVPSPFNPGQLLVMWVVYKIPGIAQGLPEGVPPGPIVSGPLSGAIQGASDFRRPPTRQDRAKIRATLGLAESPGAYASSVSDPFWWGSPRPPARSPFGIVESPRIPSKPEYVGPGPAVDKSLRPYTFTVYAIDAEPELGEWLNKEQLLTAIAGHVVAEGTLTGRR